MIKYLSIFLLLTLLSTLGCTSENSEETLTTSESSENETVTDPPPPAQSLEDRLQAIIDSRVGPDKLIGASVSIRVEGVEQWNFVSGYSDESTLISSDMRFGIASITKTVVAATMMKLVEDGLLNLDDPISAHLSLNNPNIDESITLFQLLNHLAGLKGYFQHPDIWPRVEGDLSTAINPIEIADYVGDPLFPAGTQYQYSNSHFLILGLIIEAVTG